MSSGGSEGSYLAAQPAGNNVEKLWVKTRQDTVCLLSDTCLTPHVHNAKECHTDSPQTMKHSLASCKLLLFVLGAASIVHEHMTHLAASKLVLTLKPLHFSAATS